MEGRKEDWRLKDGIGGRRSIDRAVAIGFLVFLFRLKERRKFKRLPEMDDDVVWVSRSAIGNDGGRSCSRVS
jgi:hypothetical protein